MKTKIFHSVCLWFTLVSLSAQVKVLDLKKGNCQLFKGQLYVYGFHSAKTNEVFCLYKINAQLAVTDSLFVEVSKNKSENYLQAYSDTLHDFLNIYLQKEEKNTVSIFRYTKNLEPLATIANIDIARLNNTSLFDADILRWKDDVYSVKIIRDSTGKQFYINKFELKSKESNFDYTLKWQFPFERKNVESTHVFFANKQYLLLFVDVSEGLKKGQWILRLNSTNGQLMKASKINDKGEGGTYFYGKHYFDAPYRSVHLMGQKFSEKQFDLSTNLLKLEDAAFAETYHLEIDSLGEIQNKQSFKIPIVSTSSGAKKVSSAFILKIQTLKKSPEGKLVFEGDIYKSTNKSKCFLYVNSTTYSLSPAETGYALEKSSITANNLIEDYYASKDRLDLNGRLCADSLTDFVSLFYREPGMPVKAAYKLDEETNSHWLLNKHSYNKNNVNYSLVAPFKKIYQVSNQEDISEGKAPGILTLTKDQFIIFHQLEEGKFQIKLYPW